MEFDGPIILTKSMEYLPDEFNNLVSLVPVEHIVKMPCGREVQSKFSGNFTKLLTQKNKIKNIKISQIG